MSKLLNFFFKTEDEMAAEEAVEGTPEKPVKTMFETHEHKILSIIASCEDNSQLANVHYWLHRLSNPSDSTMMRIFTAAKICRFYSIFQRFNIKKAQMRDQTVEEYTSGLQKTRWRSEAQ